MSRNGRKLKTLARIGEFEEKVPMAWAGYQEELVKGTAPDEAERIAMKSVSAKNYSQTLKTWKNHLLWPKAAEKEIMFLWSQYETGCMNLEDKDAALEEALDLCLSRYPHRQEALEIWQACGEWPPIQEHEGESQSESHEAKTGEESDPPSEEPSQKDWTDPGEYRLVPISSIKIGRRFRKDLGDTRGLAKSIEEIGLLHPPSVTPDGELIHGQRRIKAFIDLGRKEIPVIVRNLDLLLRGEHDENVERKAFTMSESVAIAKALGVKEGEKAKKRMREGGKKKGGAKLAHAEKGKTRDKVAKAVDTSHETLKKATKIVEAAEADPDKYGDLVEKMDKEGKVSPYYKEMEERKKENNRAETKNDKDSDSDNPAQKKKLRLELRDRPNLDILFVGVGSLPEPIQGLLRQKAEELRKEIIAEAQRHLAEKAEDKDQEERPEAEKGNRSGQETEGNPKPSQIKLFRHYENLNQTTLLSGNAVPSKASWSELANKHYQESLESKTGSLLRIWMEDASEEPYLDEIRFDE